MECSIRCIDRHDSNTPSLRHYHSLLTPAMRLLDLTLPSPAENLALDEALLDAAEAGELADDVLRLWEPRRPLVVVGRSSRVSEEVDWEACRAAGAPILRRASGGAAIVAGPGCLMYSVLLRYAGREHLRLLNEAHAHVLGIVAAALRASVPAIEHVGTSDLAVDGRKVSGNSLRCKRDHLLYHGTLLYDLDLGLIERLLRMPPRQPEYRAGRRHGEFVANLPVGGSELRRALAVGFDAREPLAHWPIELTQKLVEGRYSRAEWNLAR
jgi:lipoate-protein ligase A